MFRESGFSNKTVVNQFLSSFAENSIMNVGFPEIENFCNGIVFEKLDVDNDVKHSGFVHPVRQTYDLGGCFALSGFFSAFFGPYMHYTIGGDSVILFQSQFLLIFAKSYGN